METSLSLGQGIGVKVEEGKVKGRDNQPEGTKLKGTQLPVISNTVGVDQNPNKSSQEGVPNLNLARL